MHLVQQSAQHSNALLTVCSLFSYHLQMEFLKDYGELDGLLGDAGYVGSSFDGDAIIVCMQEKDFEIANLVVTTWKQTCSELCAVVVPSSIGGEVVGFHLGMGFPFPTTQWIASTAHIMKHNATGGAQPPSPGTPVFYNLSNSSVANTFRKNVKRIDASDAVDVSMVETDCTHGALEIKQANLGDHVVIFQAVFTSNSIMEHAKAGSLFVISNSLVVAVTFGRVHEITDGVIRHSAFTAKGSSGAPVFSREVPARLLGMSFYRESGSSFAESLQGLRNDMVSGNAMLAADNTYKNAMERTASGKFNHYAFMDGAHTGAKYDDRQIERSNRSIKKEAVKATADHNRATRVLQLCGELIDTFASAGGYKKDVLEMIDTISMDNITSYADYSGCQTIFRFPKKQPTMRFDKQSGTVAKFAIQPNSHTKQWKGVAQGIVYCQIIIDSDVLSNFHSGVIPSAALLDEVKKGMRDSLAKCDTVRIDSSKFASYVKK